MCPITSSYIFYDPEGGSHLLGLAAIGYIQFNYFSGHPPAEQCLGVPGGYSYSKNGGDGQVYAELDANCTGMQPFPQDCNFANPPFTVTGAAGTTYSFPGNTVEVGGLPGPAAVNFLFPNQIEDRNGNIISFTLPSKSNVSGLPVIDTLGRSLISAQYPSNGPYSAMNTDPSSYTVGGLTYTLGYTTTTASYTVPTPTQVFIGGIQDDQVSCSFDNVVNESSMPVVQKITLPNGQYYEFKYDPTFGLVNEINYPDGGWVKYTWGWSNTPSTLATFSGWNDEGNNPPFIGYCNYQYKTPVITQRTVGYSANSSAALTQDFSYITNWNGVGWTSKATTVASTDNVTGLTSQTVYTYVYVNQPSQPDTAGQPIIQLPIENTVTYYDWNNSPIKQETKTWRDQFDMTSQTTVLNGSLQSTTNYCYNSQNGPSGNCSAGIGGGFFTLLGERDEIDFGQSTPSRSTTYGYYSFSPPCLIMWSTDANPCQYWNAIQAYKPSQIVTYNGAFNGSGTRASEVDGSYDQQTPSSVSVVSGTHDETNYGSSSTLGRGNLTTLVKWSNSGSSPTATLTYDETGQVLTKKDACGNGSCSDMIGTSHTTTYSYADCPTGGNAPGPSNAYLTQITDPLGHSEKYCYNYVTGELTSSTDENIQITNYTYNDSLDRLTKISYPDGGATSISYNDSVPSVTTQILQTPNPTKDSVSIMDGLGHVIQTQLTSDPNGTDYVNTTYNGEGQVYTKTNPFRGSSPPASTTTTYYYDALGRPIKTTEQDGSILQWCYDGALSLPAVTTCSAHFGSTSTQPGSITGTWVDYTDERGNHWQRTSDAFGRLTQVMEPNGSSQTPSMETDYSFDSLSNLLSVTQWGGASGSSGARTRSFTYDSLARLLTAQNPESGTATYTYDLNGNVMTKTSPLVNASSGLQTIGYCNDALNRMTYKFYSGSYSCTSPSGFAASYSYDTSSISGAANTIGRLTDEKAYIGSTLVAEGSPYKFDAMGRLQNEQQCPLNASCSSPYTLNYTYDYAGDVTFADNGLASASTDLGFSFTYDGAQHLSVAQTSTQPSSWSTSTYPPFLLQANGTSTPAYDPWGHLVNGQLGLVSLGATPVIQTTRAYDNRGRISTETGGSFYSLTALNGSSSGYDNVGNLKYYTDSVMGNWTYSYDTLNRLTTAQNTATTPVSVQFAGMYGCWTYDGFGNRTQEELFNGSPTSCSGNVVQLTVTTPTANNQVSRFQYDDAGNVLNDGYNQYLYDPEGRLCAVAFPNGSGGNYYEQYLYDADGLRVAKGSASGLSCAAPTSANGFGLTNQYLLGLGGEQVTEMNGSGVVQHTNVFTGGKLLATYDFTGNLGLHFALADPLGTKRVQVTPTGSGTGSTELSCMSLPFGNGLGNPRNTDCVGPGVDATEHHFTSKERDTESGNDYFGARYYASSMGRFMSPDPFIPFNRKKDEFQAWIANPQHWNMYAYALNNPLKYTDPTGMTETIYYFLNSNLTQAQRDFINKHLDEIENGIADKMHKAGIKDVVFKDGGQLSSSQVQHMLSDHPTGVATLNFANQGYGGWHSDSANGGTNGMVSAVLMGNFDGGHPVSTDLVQALANVGAHELGHGMGFYSHTTPTCGSMCDQIYNMFNHDLMNENQGNFGISTPKYYDMTIPQNRQAVDEINKQPEYQPQ